MSNPKRQARREQLEKRYSGCEDAIMSLNIMLEANKMLKRAIDKLCSDEVTKEGLAKTRTTINYDLLAMKDEISDIAMGIAEDIKEVDDA